MMFRYVSRCSVIAVTAALLICTHAVNAQQAPPELGQETKGQPAVDETLPLPEAEPARLDELPATSDDTEEQSLSGIDSLLGEAEIIESKRENGQVYLIELEHSSGTKQYVEETDSDGKIESRANDLEAEPNLPKWKIGSW